MTDTFSAACVQNCASADMETTLAKAADLVRQAAAEGADLICLPEYFSCLEVQDGVFELGARPEPEHPALPLMGELAANLGKWILLGSLAIETGTGKIRNRSYLLDAGGAVAARYDKIHLFDVDLEGGESYRESDGIEPGPAAETAATPWGLMGLTVCYDLRFAQLYRSLAQAGAEFLTVPAAFTKTTGQAHWHVLVRARAIETGSYVLAACQCGRHGESESYGHSLIVDPWGRVLAEGGEEPGFVLAEIDPARVAEARRMIPALEHDRNFADPDSGERLAAAV
jgi:predicted amidohydrolase